MIREHETTDTDYRPEPEDLTGIVLSDSLTDLTEYLAENIHEVWARNRMEEGWTYGPVRDDASMQHPDLVPYRNLPESEKEYDRATAISTLKLIVKAGYRIEK